MLSRAADHLYWMSRYVERAESLARLVDAHYRVSLLPHTPATLARSLRSTLEALQVQPGFGEARAETDSRAVFEFLSLDARHDGSILNCLRAARENARAVRGTLTSELWETLNCTWLEARSVAVHGASRADIGQFLEWVKERSHLTRGVMIGTMLRDEAFHFARIGTFLERADNSARILTAHRQDLQPGADAGGVPDPYEWSVLLRALSAFEVYRRRYREVITPVKVAELLILCADMPRSLLRCCKEVYQNLRSVANEQSAETERRAGEMHAMLHFAQMPDLVESGLAAFLRQFLAKLRDLSERIASDFLVPPAEA
ncbi:MAG TPA: alpha-E domain-containing protein [Steroidobacteraceae bacterium]|nr:alpha-E domain-containing protein [Steroidobacteraceae bacterium]